MDDKKYVKIKDSNISFLRDIDSQGIVNTDQLDYDEFLKRKEAKQQKLMKEQQLERRISKIEELLDKMLLLVEKEKMKDGVG